MSYTLKIWYHASSEDQPQVHTGLGRQDAETGAGAFLRDLLAFEGQGVRKLMVEKEPTAESAMAQVEQAGAGLKVIRESAERQGFDVR